jgi:hypothetical protein
MAPERILGNHYHDVVSTGTIVLLVARHPTSTVSNASFISFLIGNLPAQIQHNNSPRKKKHMKSSIKQGDDDNNKESLKSPFQNFIANNKSVLTLIQRLNFWNYFLAIFSGSYPRLCVCFCGGCYDQDTWHQPKPKFLNVYGCVSSKRVVGLV